MVTFRVIHFDKNNLVKLWYKFGVDVESETPVRNSQGAKNPHKINI